MPVCNRETCKVEALKPELIETPVSDAQRESICKQYAEVVPQSDCPYQAYRSHERIFGSIAIFEMEAGLGGQNA